MFTFQGALGLEFFETDSTGGEAFDEFDGFFNLGGQLTAGEGVTDGVAGHGSITSGLYTHLRSTVGTKQDLLFVEVTG